MSRRKQVERLLHLIQRLDEPDKDEVLIAYLMSDSYLQDPELWGQLQEFRRRVEQQLEDDPELRKRLEVLRQRQQLLEEALPPPEVHFQQLQARLRESKLKRIYIQKRYIRVLKFALAALFVLMTTYGLLYTYLYVRMSPFQRWVWKTEVPEIRAESLVFRGGTTAEQVPVMSDFLAGLKHLRQAKAFDTFLPYLRQEELEEAATYFLRVREKSAPGSYLYLEATYYLALTYLADDRIQEALPLLEEVAVSEGPHAPEARRLLQKLQA